MTVIKDRRNEPAHDKFGTDRERFRQRNMKRIKEGIQNKIAGDSLGDLGKGGVKIPIPKESIHEPYLHHEGGGFGQNVYPGDTLKMKREDPLALHAQFGSRPRVFVGNMSYDAGDVIPVPSGGGGGGGGGSGSGEGASDSDDITEDDFIWVNEADLMSILFDGRELPDMVKLHAQSAVQMQSEHAGYTNKGPTNRLDMQLTNIKRKQKSLLLDKVAKRRVLENLSEQFNILAKNDDDYSPLKFKGVPKETFLAAVDAAAERYTDKPEASYDSEIETLQACLETLKEKFESSLSESAENRLGILERRLPEQFRARGRAKRFKEENLTYEFDDDVPKPNAKAVMFCQMDVSGSMDQEKKNTAKVFFWLLNKFLKSNYKEVDIVFLSHTTVAKEVDEQEFFYGRESGGTKVSPVIQKTLDIIAERYPTHEWNIYSAQASDGDNWDDDNAIVAQLMDTLLNKAQAHYYIEVPWGDRRSQMLRMYEQLAEKYQGRLRTAGGLKNAVDAMEAFVSMFPARGEKAPKSSFSPSI